MKMVEKCPKCGGRLVYRPKDGDATRLEATCRCSHGNPVLEVNNPKMATRKKGKRQTRIVVIPEKSEEETD